ncbi:uncharacterized protein LOC134842363 [Symsagittifera roscoffensis]|uniref:uncharacterized protein LOC134842363 n=1 Tax=Symsagittifera roscoffensis TaxID=84072 RepID=UPI00307BECB1
MEAWPRADQIDINQPQQSQLKGKLSTSESANMPLTDNSGTRHRGNPSSAVTPISHGLGGGIGVDRSRHGSNVTMVGGVTPQSHKRSLHGGDMDGKKAVSSTTTIVDDDVNRQESEDGSRELLALKCCMDCGDGVVGVACLHIASVVIAMVLLVAALCFHFLLCFKLALFRDRKGGVRGFGDHELKLAPNEFNLLSFLLNAISLLAQIAWQCFLCCKMKLSWGHLGMGEFHIVFCSWTSHLLVYNGAIALEIAHSFTVYSGVEWGSCLVSGLASFLLLLSLRHQFNSLVRNQHASFLWCWSGVSVCERYLGHNAVGVWLVLRVTDFIFYLGLSLHQTVGLSVLLSDLVIFLISLFVLITLFVVEVFVLGDVSTLYLCVWPYCTLIFLNTLLSNVGGSRVLQSYFSASLLGISCFLLCIKVVVTMELRNQSPEKESFSYMTSEFQFVLNTRQGRSARSRSARAATAMSATSTRGPQHHQHHTPSNDLGHSQNTQRGGVGGGAHSRKISVAYRNQNNSRTKTAVVSVTHENNASPVHLSQRNQTRAVTPVSTQTTAGGENERQIQVDQYHNPRATPLSNNNNNNQIYNNNQNSYNNNTNSNDNNSNGGTGQQNHQEWSALEDSGVSFMEFQNEFCRHYPNYGFVDHEEQEMSPQPQ